MQVAIRVKDVEWGMPPGRVVGCSRNWLKALIHLSACACLTYGLFHIVDASILVDILRTQVGRCVDSS